DGRVALFVPLVEGNVRCALQGNRNGLSVVAETGNPRVEAAAATVLFVSVQPVGESLHDWLARCAAAVARHLGVKLRHEKSLPDFIDSFGWCTWDAFYKDVSADNVLRGLRSFRDAGVLPRFLIIDDGWQTETDRGSEQGRRLTSFTPNE